jgi:hypothetical protein
MVPGASSEGRTPLYIILRSLTRCDIYVIIPIIMTKDFLETVIEEQKILDIGLKQSKANKKERLEKEKTISEQLQDELEPIDND